MHAGAGRARARGARGPPGPAHRGAGSDRGGRDYRFRGADGHSAAAAAAAAARPPPPPPPPPTAAAAAADSAAGDRGTNCWRWCQPPPRGWGGRRTAAGRSCAGGGAVAENLWPSLPVLQGVDHSGPRGVKRPNLHSVPGPGGPAPQQRSGRAPPPGPTGASYQRLPQRACPAQPRVGLPVRFPGLRQSRQL